MRLKDFPTASAFAGFLEDLHHLQHGARIVPRLGHEANAERIGLAFVVAAEFQLKHLVGELGGDGGAVPATSVVARPDAHRHHQRAAQLSLGHVLGGVPGDDVPSLVPQHARELRLIL